jgi:hypothetical protein
MDVKDILEIIYQHFPGGGDNFKERGRALKDIITLVPSITQAQANGIVGLYDFERF